MKRILITMAVLTLTLPLAGCWDRNEINEYAFWIGTAVDLKEDGTVHKSAQIAVPAQFRSSKGNGGGGQRANIVLTATGSSIIEMEQQIQDKLPRKIFLGHRKSIFIGERLARKGITEIMDQIMRNPDTRIRTDIFVVNNGEGKEVLDINSPFHQFSAIAAVDQDRFCRIGDTALRDFVLDAGRDGIRPSMPMIDISPKNEQEKNKVFNVKSAAIFNKNMQMVGEVKQRESLELFWVKGTLQDQYMTEEMEEGSFSIYEYNLKRSIRTTMHGGKIKAYVKLAGSGRIIENNSSIDLSISSERKRVERQLNKLKEQHVEGTVKMVQRKYGQDVFGIGEEFHREHPYQWKKLRSKWDQVFPTLEVAVDVELKIKSLGELGKPVPR